MSNQKPQATKRWGLKCFLGGVVIGVLIGFLMNEIYEGHGPYRAQISVGFWGLAGGVLGLLIDVVHRRFRKNQEKEAEKGAS